MKHPTFLALALMTAAASLLPAQTSAADTPSPDARPADASPSAASAIRLQFAWPETLKGQLEQTRLSSQRADDEESSNSLTAVVDLQTSRAGDRLRIDLGKIQLRNVAKSEEQSPEQRAMMMVAAGAMLPDWYVTADGHYAGMQDVGGFREALVEAARRHANGKVDTATLRSLAEQLTVEDTLNDTLRGEWSAMVSDWIGMELAVGETYGGSFETRSPLAPDVPVTQETRLKITALGPCMRDGVERRCAEIESVSELDAASVRKLVDAIGAQLAADPNAKGQSIKEIAVETTTRLRTEIDTLVPHLFMVDKRMQSTFVNDGKELALERRSYVGYEFHYGSGKR